VPASNPSCSLKRLDLKADGFLKLVEASRAEGYWMLVRLKNEWEGGENRFRRRGETLLSAWCGSELAGVCGLNVDPYVERRREGRVRHLYVGQKHRRVGIGRQLVMAIIGRARLEFPALNTRAPEEAFPFYEALGFRRVVDDPFLTHRKALRRPVRRRREGR